MIVSPLCLRNMRESYQSSADAHIEYCMQMLRALAISSGHEATLAWRAETHHGRWDLLLRRRCEFLFDANQLLDLREEPAVDFCQLMNLLQTESCSEGVSDVEDSL